MKKTYFKTSLKDNLASAAVLAATAVAIIGGFVNSTDARADQPTVQHMEAIVIAAPRIEHVTLDTIVVTAPREV